MREACAQCDNIRNGKVLLTSIRLHLYFEISSVRSRKVHRPLVLGPYCA